MAKKVILSNSYIILKSFKFQCLFGKENKQHWTLLKVTMHLIWVISLFSPYLALLLIYSKPRSQISQRLC